jgi:hypothetical protein
MSLTQAMRMMALMQFNQLRYHSRRNPYPKAAWDQIRVLAGTLIDEANAQPTARMLVSFLNYRSLYRWARQSASGSLLASAVVGLGFCAIVADWLLTRLNFPP